MCTATRMDSTPLSDDLSLKKTALRPGVALKAIEWLGTVLSFSAAFWLALAIPSSQWGFVLFLVSNVCWGYFAVRTHAHGLLTLQLGLAVLNVLGVVRWFGWA
jgi:hypothetical protein